MRKKARLLSVLLAILCVLGALLSAAGEVWAAVAGGNESSNTIIWQKTLVNAINSCYNYNTINGTVQLDSFRANGTNAIFKKKQGSILVPGTGSMDCRQVFEKLNQYFNKRPSSPTDLGFLLSSNDDESTRIQENCVSIQYEYLQNNGRWVDSPVSTAEACFKTVGGVIEIGSVPTIGAQSNNGPIYLRLSGGMEDASIDLVYKGPNPSQNEIYLPVTFAGRSWSDFYASFQSKATQLGDNSSELRNIKVSETHKNDQESETGRFWQYELPRDSEWVQLYDYNSAKQKAVEFYTDGETIADYKFTSSGDVVQSWKMALRAMAEYPANNGSVSFVGEENKCAASREEALKIGSTEYAYYSDNGQWCAITFREEIYRSNGSPSFNIVGDSLNKLVAVSATEVLERLTKRNQGFLTTDDVKEAKRKSCQNGAERYLSKAHSLLNDSHTEEALRQRANSIIDQLNTIVSSNQGRYWAEDTDGIITCLTIVDFNGNVVPLDGETGEIDYTNPGINGDDEPLDPGENSGAEASSEDVCGSEVNGLGWILCPVVNLLSKTVTSIYDNYIQENFLEVKAEWLDTEAPLYKNGWAKFRDYANIVFAILLVVVILSQVTGIGITNYGIKKMLPRLIVVVVMINLSFFICQLAVDVSNIVGYALNDLLSGMGVSFRASASGATLPSADGTGILNALSIGGLGLAAGTIGSWVVPLLLSLLTAMISVVFAGIILGVRQAGILILVVISPLAIACYALDGTKPLFDKWRKLFTNLLMVFPICGLLMGGGVFASGVLGGVSGASIFLQLVSALLVVVPFFFIPTVVKGALAAVGNIGTKLSMIGRGARGSAMRAAKGSDTYQHLDAAAGAAHVGVSNWMRKGLRKFPGVSEVADSKLGQFLGRGGTRRRAQFIQKQSRLAYSDADARSIANSGLLTADRRKGIQAAADERAENIATDEEQAAMRAEKDFNVGDEKQLSKRLQELAENYDKTHDITLRRKIKAVTKFMLDFDKGRNQFDQDFHQFAQDDSKSATTEALNKFVQMPDIMSKLKQTGHRGTVKLSQDLSSGNSLKTFNGYVASQTHKFAPEAVGQIDTSVLEQQLAAIKSGDLKGQDLTKLVTTYDTAMKSETSRNKISVENQSIIKDIFAAAGHSNAIYIPR